MTTFICAFPKIICNPFGGPLKGVVGGCIGDRWGLEFPIIRGTFWIVLGGP